MEATDKTAPRSSEEASAEIERLREELRREHDLYLRALADFDNFRRRTERDSATAARSGKREIILSLLGVLDGFDRALQHLKDAPSSVSEGLQALHRQFIGLLQAQGITPMQTVGEPFNPELHEAIGSVQSSEVESGAVAEEVQRGYRWGNDVLRPALVRVAL
jgi:molecular chaperone GrpE